MDGTKKIVVNQLVVKYWRRVLVAGMIFLIGFFSGYMAFKSGILGFLYRQVEDVIQLNEYDPQNPEEELLRVAFTDPLVPDLELVYSTSADITLAAEQVQRLLLDAEVFPKAFEEIRVIDSRFEGDRFNLDYDLNGNVHTAYSYFLPADKEGVSCGVLIIPGSGLNQSTSIFEKDLSNYHRDIADLTDDYCDTYIYVKPNEDFLAIHDGERKLAYTFITNYLINAGGAYSATYLVHSIAISKYLNSEYEQFVLMGLSQGGDSALLNAVQSEPDLAVIASGYSVLQLKESGFNQIVIPDLYEDFGKEELLVDINSLTTRFLFSYGRDEATTYKLEAEKGYTCEFFAELDNVFCIVHDGAHQFPQDEIHAFFEAWLD